MELVRVTELTSEFEGRASYVRADGSTKKITLPFTMPGDEVEVEVKRGRVKAACVVAKSAEHILPRCVHFGSCGGCAAQHIPYSVQLSLKEQHIKTLFEPYSVASTTFHPIIPSCTPYEYRNKMEFSFSEDRKGEKFFGLMLKNRRGDVFNVTECHLVDPWFVDALQHARTWWHESTLHAYNYRNNTGSLRTLILRHAMVSNDRLAMLTVSGNPDFALKKKDLDTFVEKMRAVGATSIFLRIQQVMKGHPTQMYEMCLFGPDYIREEVTIQGKSLEFHVSPQAFFQPNTHTAQKLYNRVCELAKITPESIVYDLYAGIGVFGMCVASFVKEVIAVEISPEAAYDAKTNAARMQIKNFSIYNGDVGKLLEDGTVAAKPPDVVIVDPPRAGLDARAVHGLIKLAPKTIVYVACNPETQAANVAIFLQNGFILSDVQPVDQFPQTPHCENIVIMHRP